MNLFNTNREPKKSSIIVDDKEVLCIEIESYIQQLTITNGTVYRAIRQESDSCIYKKFNIPERASIFITRSGNYYSQSVNTNNLTINRSNTYNQHSDGIKIIDIALNANNIVSISCNYGQAMYSLSYRDMEKYAHFIMTTALGNTVPIYIMHGVTGNNGYYAYIDVKFNEATNRYYVDALGIMKDIKFNVETASLIHNDTYYGVIRTIYDNLNISFDYNTITNRNIILDIFEKNVFSDESANAFIRTNYIHHVKKIDGILKTYTKVKPFYDSSTDLVNIFIFSMLLDTHTKTIEGLKISVLFNTLFKSCETKIEFDTILADIRKHVIINSPYESTHSNMEKILHSHPVAMELRKAAIKRTSTGAFTKKMADVDFITDLPQEKYPLTYAAVYGGDLPIGTFFRKNADSYFVFNDNWALWEKMLELYPEEAVELAKNASCRTTYEKDIMSYFYFVLVGLPAYLKKHTGKNWTCKPKLVTSSNELTPPSSTGTTKTRSALTPIVNNENYTVDVPYVSMVLHGRNSTYCYALDYNIVTEGQSVRGNIAMTDIEKELNGRDDYGLMYYTLTGSDSATGYPTFLIIFERLIDSTRVHFHRTHPMRSKNGDYNPIHNWTVGCYKWMIGNIPFDKIKASQGDLAFVEIDNFPTENITSVDSYDNHRFRTNVDYAPYTKKDKQNVLGYVKLDNDTYLDHNEHLSRLIPKGIYEIRQCRSWEANPVGIWSLRID